MNNVYNGDSRESNARGQKDDMNPPHTHNVTNEQSSILKEMRQSNFPLKEGDFTISFPNRLSTESVEDLGIYLELLMKKIRRESKDQNGESDSPISGA